MKKEGEKMVLGEKDFEFICPVKTDTMKNIEGGYFCYDCEKKVFDVTEYSEDEFTTLKTEQSDLCVNFKKIVTTTLILNSAFCVASGETYTLSKPILIEQNREVEMGGGISPITFFEEENVTVPIEPFIVPPSREDENSTEKDEKGKAVI